MWMHRTRPYSPEGTADSGACGATCGGVLAAEGTADSGACEATCGGVAAAYGENFGECGEGVVTVYGLAG